MYKITLAVLLAMAVSSCAITQTVEPAEISQGSEICIIEKPDVRAGVLETYLKVLTENNIAHKVIDAGSGTDACEWTSTYEARWTWNLLLHIGYAEIKVFHNGELDGEAIYSVPEIAGSEKFTKGETIIRDLVEQLYSLPRTTPTQGG